ncbi:MAG: DUF790 family protein [Candidatus Bathyarchaeia archaeon]
MMYSMMKNGDLFTVKLEGPVSLLKPTRRYGAAIGKVFPEIVRGRPWRVEAKILKGNRILNFFIDSVRSGGLFPDVAPQEGHVLIGDVLVDKRLISQVREVLKSNVGDGAPLTRVLDAISQFNLPDPIAAITYCGFQVVWHDLLPENAIVKPSP